MSGAPFRYFVMFAEMRTGSNFLEQNLNQFSDLHCHGELFNPHFVGKAKKDELFGVTLKDRERNPAQLIDIILKNAQGVVPGFRFFHDHDARILKKCLADVDCAKIILSRNPLDSYVSRKIAAETGQWKLTNVKQRKKTKIEFVAAEFERSSGVALKFQATLTNALQRNGQTAFHIGYDDLQSLDVLNGLAAFLGSSERAKSLDKTLKRQNPTALRDKVTNYSEMVVSLGELARANLASPPNLEPQRGASVPSMVAAKNVPLVFLPIKGAPFRRVIDWMVGHDALSSDCLVRGFNQKTLRKWCRESPGFQSFTVLRHPVARAYFSFCEYILSDTYGAYRDLRHTLAHTFEVKIPGNGISRADYDLSAHRDAFCAFLKFLKLNLSDQTSMRVDPAWSSQSAVIEGAAKVLPLMHIVHEPSLQAALCHIESLVEIKNISVPALGESVFPYRLSDIYDADIEAASRDIYARDYLRFGFADWHDHAGIITQPLAP